MQLLKEKIIENAKHLGMDLCGVADAALANEKAPLGYAPEDQLPGARAVVIFGQCQPSGIFHTSEEKSYRDVYYMRSERTIYERLDKVAH